MRKNQRRVALLGISAALIFGTQMAGRALAQNYIDDGSSGGMIISVSAWVPPILTPPPAPQTVTGLVLYSAYIQPRDVNLDDLLTGQDLTFVWDNFSQAYVAASSASDLVVLDTGDAGNGITLLVTTSSVPEPASLGLLALGTAALMGRHRRTART